MVSSFMTPVTCLKTSGDFAIEGSLSIWAASDIVDTGVFNSCVILFMKSFFISDKRFCLKSVITVNENVIKSITVKIIDGIANDNSLKTNSPFVGK